MFMTDKELNKKYAKQYKQGLTTKPDPSVLETDYHQYDSKDGRLDMKAWNEMIERNRAIIRGWNDKSVKGKNWVGRTLTDQVGDGYAVYVVVKENTLSVRVKVCRGLGDDWVSRYFGEEKTVKKEDAMNFFPWEFGKELSAPYDMVRKVA